jgi:hypothetical protein
MTRLEALGPNEEFGEIKAVWDCFTDRALRSARSEGRSETHDQYAWDGLLAMARAARFAAERPEIVIKPIRPRFVIRVDATKLKSDRSDGEVCEIPGVGPIDLATARRLLPAGMIEFLVAEAVDIKSLAHGGRKANIGQLAALWSRDYVCEIRGCEKTEHLEIDHIAEYGKTRKTCATKLGFKCPHCHDLKTNHGYRDGPLGEDGRRDLTPPDNPPPDTS